MSTVSEKPWYQFPLEFLLPTLGNVSASALATYLLTKASPLAGRAFAGAVSFASGSLGGGLGQLGVEAICQDSINWKRTLGTALQILVSGGEAYFGQDRIFATDPIWKKTLTYTGKIGASCYNKPGVGSFLIGSAFNIFQSEINRSYVEEDGIWQRIAGAKKWDWTYGLEVLADIGLGGAAFGINRHLTPKISDRTLETSHIRSFLDDDAERFFRSMTESNDASLHAARAGIRAGEYFAPRNPELSREFYNDAGANLEDYYSSLDLPIPKHPYSLAWKLGQEEINACLGSEGRTRDTYFFIRFYKIADQWGDNPARYQALKALGKIYYNDASYTEKAIALAPRWAWREKLKLKARVVNIYYYKAISMMEIENSENGIRAMANIYKKLGLRPTALIRIANALGRPLSDRDKKHLLKDLKNCRVQFDKRYLLLVKNVYEKNNTLRGSGTSPIDDIDVVIMTALYHEYEVLLRGAKIFGSEFERDILQKQVWLATQLNRHFLDIPAGPDNKGLIWTARLLRLNEKKDRTNI